MKPKYLIKQSSPIKINKFLRKTQQKNYLVKRKKYNVLTKVSKNNLKKILNH